MIIVDPGWTWLYNVYGGIMVMASLIRDYSGPRLDMVVDYGE